MFDKRIPGSNPGRTTGFSVTDFTRKLCVSYCVSPRLCKNKSAVVQPSNVAIYHRAYLKCNIKTPHASRTPIFQVNEDPIWTYFGHCDRSSQRWYIHDHSISIAGDFYQIVVDHPLGHGFDGKLLVITLW